MKLTQMLVLGVCGLLVSVAPSVGQNPPGVVGSWPTPGWSIALAPDGTFLLADVHADNVTRYSASGGVLSSWGERGEQPGGFINATGIAVGADGSVYVADSHLHRIQRFTSSGQFLSMWGGFGSGQGQLYFPIGLAVAGDGHIFVCDRGNNRVQEFSAEGQFVREITEGPLTNPIDVTISALDEVIVSDRENIISVYNRAGVRLRTWGGPGTDSGRFNNPVAVAASSTGRVYVVDRLNHRIQAFQATGQFIVAWGQLGSAPNEFLFPTDIVVSSTGLIYVVDGKNGRVQVFDPTVSVVATSWSALKARGF